MNILIKQKRECKRELGRDLNKKSIKGLGQVETRQRLLTRYLKLLQTEKIIEVIIEWYLVERKFYFRNNHARLTSNYSFCNFESMS